MKNTIPTDENLPRKEGESQKKKRQKKVKSSEEAKKNISTIPSEPIQEDPSEVGGKAGTKKKRGVEGGTPSTHPPTGGRGGKKKESISKRGISTQSTPPSRKKPAIGKKSTKSTPEAGGLSPIDRPTAKTRGKKADAPTTGGGEGEASKVSASIQPRRKHKRGDVEQPTAPTADNAKSARPVKKSGVSVVVGEPSSSRVASKRGVSLKGEPKEERKEEVKKTTAKKARIKDPKKKDGRKAGEGGESSEAGLKKGKAAEEGGGSNDGKKKATPGGEKTSGKKKGKKKVKRGKKKKKPARKRYAKDAPLSYRGMVLSLEMSNGVKGLHSKLKREGCFYSYRDIIKMLLESTRYLMFYSHDKAVEYPCSKKFLLASKDIVMVDERRYYHNDCHAKIDDIITRNPSAKCYFRGLEANARIRRFTNLGMFSDAVRKELSVCWEVRDSYADDGNDSPMMSVSVRHEPLTGIVFIDFHTLQVAGEDHRGLYFPYVKEALAEYLR